MEMLHSKTSYNIYKMLDEPPPKTFQKIVSWTLFCANANCSEYSIRVMAAGKEMQDLCLYIVIIK